MTAVNLTRIRLNAGRYEGVLVADEAPPVIEALHLERVIGTAEVAPIKGKRGQFTLSFDLPATVLSDGVQVISLRSAENEEVLDRITVLSGDPLEEDLRAELALMREELELLKRAFRRHCAETGQD